MPRIDGLLSAFSDHPARAELYTALQIGQALLERQRPPQANQETLPLGIVAALPRLDTPAWIWEALAHAGYLPQQLVEKLDATAKTRPGFAAALTANEQSPPGYTILRLLGRGGAGAVYLANQTNLARQVALKIFHLDPRSVSARLARARREAEATARLAHPGIVQVFDLGSVGDSVWLAMEYAASGSLDQRLSLGPLSPDEAAKLMVALCRAMQTAHRAGIIHRDLKPANILLTADGQAKVSDFGLAALLDEDARLTTSGEILGTLAYMAPEQARSAGERLGPWTDVYALGGILYECLSGHPPFRAATPLACLRQVLDEEPLPLHRLRPDIPEDLALVCGKCLNKEPQRRYATAEALSDELERYLAGEPIQARPEPSWRRLVRRARRHPRLFVAATVAAGSLLLMLGAITYSAVDGYRTIAALRSHELKLLALQSEVRQLDEQVSLSLWRQTAGNAGIKTGQDADQQLSHILTVTEQIAPDLFDTAQMRSTRGALAVLRGQVQQLLRENQLDDARRLLASKEYLELQQAFDAAVSRFAELVHRQTDRSLQLVQAEAFWSLLAAGLAFCLLSCGGVAFFLMRSRNRQLEVRTLTPRPGATAMVVLGLLISLCQAVPAQSVDAEAPTIAPPPLPVDPPNAESVLFRSFAAELKGVDRASAEVNWAALRSFKQQYNLLNPTPKPLLREFLTDRPDKTISPVTVDAGHVQIEMDFVTATFDRWQSARQRQTTTTTGGTGGYFGQQPATVGDKDDYVFGLTNLRVGLLNNVDLHLFFRPGQWLRKYGDVEPAGSQNFGLGDMRVLLKENLWGNEGGETAAACVQFVDLPVGMRGLSTRAWEGGASFTGLRRFPNKLYLAAEAGLEARENRAGNGYHVEIPSSASLAFSVTDNLSAKGEFASVIITDGPVEWIGVVALAVLYSIGKNEQFDLGINLGVTPAASDFNPYVGWARRF